MHNIYKPYQLPHHSPIPLSFKLQCDQQLTNSITPLAEHLVHIQIYIMG